MTSDDRRGGERAAADRLAAWLAVAIARYGEHWDDIAGRATSRLSTDLHFGCLSPLAAEAALVGVPGAAPFVRHLCWRDFYLQIIGARRAATRGRRLPSEPRPDDLSLVPHEEPGIGLARRRPARARAPRRRGRRAELPELAVDGRTRDRGEPPAAAQPHAPGAPVRSARLVRPSSCGGAPPTGSGRGPRTMAPRTTRARLLGYPAPIVPVGRVAA